MYAVIDKRNKNEERLLRPNVAGGKSLEDMYAKVMKKKRENDDYQQSHLENATASVSSIFNSEQTKGTAHFEHCHFEKNRTSWSSHDSNEIHKHIMLKENLNGEFDAGYEAVSDPKFNMRRSSAPSDADYETLRPPGKSRNSLITLPAYSQPIKQRQISNASSEDPGYEKVRLRRRIDTDIDTDSEPNYESMPQEPNYASVDRAGDSDADPNYESVNGDPNYESVCEPPYERVRPRNYDYETTNGDIEDDVQV